MRAISPHRGLHRLDMIMATYMAASAYLSRRESRKLPR